VKATHTPPRSVRVPNDLWKAVTDKAAQEGRTITDVINKALLRYLRSPRPTTER
jgi:hypothetical protein